MQVSKDLILSKLEDLKKIYQIDIEKKWNLRALITAINAIKSYEGDIITGSQLQKELKGIGAKIAKRIDEIIETGNLSELPDDNKISKTSPDKLLLITGVGLVKAKKWIDMGIYNIDDVKKAIKDKKIKITHHIEIGIKYYEDFQGMIPKEEIDNIKKLLKKNIKNNDFDICGSYRRGLSQSGDIDVLIESSDNTLQNIVHRLTEIGFIKDSLTLKGDTKYMGVCKLDGYNIARRIDIRMIPKESYFTSLLYFTGNKNFNIYLRNIALKNNYSLNEYALTNSITGEKILLKSENEIFDILKIPYLIPSERNKNIYN